MNEITPIFNNKEEFIKQYLKDKEDKLSTHLDKLPNQELPFMESHLRALYFQSYFSRRQYAIASL